MRLSDLSRITLERKFLPHAIQLQHAPPQKSELTSLNYVQNNFFETHTLVAFIRIAVDDCSKRIRPLLLFAYPSPIRIYYTPSERLG
jgi:hypothetical protein